jgi:predicted dehydrogenase
MCEQRVRIGFVGAGANTRVRHIPGFKAISGVELVSVANRSRASGEKVANEFGIPRVFDHWQDLVKSDDIDAVCIGTWPYMHCEITLASLAAGKHVLTEARMAMNATEAKTMLAASRDHPKLVTQIVPGPPTLEVDSTMQSLLASGYLGKLLSVELHVLQGFADPKAPLHWRHDKALSGYNILSMGIWMECLQRSLGQPAKVMAMGLTSVPQRHDNNTGQLKTVTVPDQVDVLATYSEGAVAHLRFSAVTGFAPPIELWLFGNEGTLKFEPESKRLFGGRRGDKALQEILIPKENRIGWRVEEEFINAIRGREKITRTSFEDGVKYMEFTEAVARSLSEGRAISLPLAS